MMNRIVLALVASLLVAVFPHRATAQTAKPAAKATTKAAPKAARPSAAPIHKNPYLGAIVVDAATGQVLFEDQADARGVPASVLKLMDLLIILEKVDSHQMTLADPVPVSLRASKMGGSQVFLEPKESFSVDEMLYALMIQSANDAAVALAEKTAGSCEAFVDLMNQRAKQLGMNNTTFHSVHGLPPGAGQEYDITTARDLSILCRELLKHPDALRYTSTRSRPFRQPGSRGAMVMNNHNHLLGHVDGCDGFKTGYITMAGYSNATTASRNGRRVIAIVLDSSTLKLRDTKAAELLARGLALLPQAAPQPIIPAAPTTPAVTPPAKH
jgi:D-alanyl-D-alanine carboxypeptidase (penicillin-binding protein 5/6)